MFSIRVKENTVKRLDELSAKTEHSRNELIRILPDYAPDHFVIQDEMQQSAFHPDISTIFAYFTALHDRLQ